MKWITSKNVCLVKRLDIFTCVIKTENENAIPKTAVVQSDRSRKASWEQSKGNELCVSLRDWGKNV